METPGSALLTLGDTRLDPKSVKIDPQRPEIDPFPIFRRIQGALENCRIPVPRLGLLGFGARTKVRKWRFSESRNTKMTPSYPTLRCRKGAWRAFPHFVRPAAPYRGRTPHIPRLGMGAEFRNSHQTRPLSFETQGKLGVEFRNSTRKLPNSTLEFRNSGQTRCRVSKLNPKITKLDP